MIAKGIPEWIDWGENTSKGSGWLQECLGLAGEAMGVDTLEAGDSFWETLGIAEKSRFSSGTRLWQSTNSEGLRITDASRLNNISNPFLGQLVFIFMPINPAKVGWRSATEWIKASQKLKSPQKGITTLLEAPHRHLLVTPPSHFTPQKVKGFVAAFSCLRAVTKIKKYSYPIG